MANAAEYAGLYALKLGTRSNANKAFGLGYMVHDSTHYCVVFEFQPGTDNFEYSYSVARDSGYYFIDMAFSKH